MLIDLLNQENYISFNVDLARIFGLSQAVYLSELIAINGKAIYKDKVDNNYFVVNRNYIEKRTTISEKDQIDFDKGFANINLISIGDNENTLKIDLTVLTGLAVSADETLYTDISAMVNTKKKRKTKKDAGIERCDSLITSTNEELRAAYHDWIVILTERKGLQSNTTIIEAQKVIDNASHRNLDVALEIIKIATINVWPDMTWAVNSYERNHKNNLNKPSYMIPKSATAIEHEVELSTEEF